MFPTENRSLPFALRRRLQQEEERAKADEYVDRQRKSIVYAEQLNYKSRRCEPREDAAWRAVERLALQQKRRDKLRQLYDQEYSSYLRVLESRKMTESQRLEMQHRYIQQKLSERARKKEEFNKAQYDKQFEANCDEVRGLKQRVNDCAAVLTLDYQRRIKQEQIARSSEESLRMDQMRLQDYAKYQQEQRELVVQRRLAVQKMRQQMEGEIAEKEAREARQEAQRLLELQKQREAGEIYAKIQQLQRDVELQKKLENRLFFEVQMEVYYAAQKASRARQTAEEKESIEQVNQEIRLQAISDLKAKEALRDEQACYLLLLEYRQRVVDAEVAALEQHYHKLIVSGKLAEYQRKESERARQRWIQAGCLEFNQRQQENSAREKEAEKRLAIEQEKREILDIYREEEEKQLIALQKQLDQQREWVEFLKMQKEQRYVNEEAELARNAQLYREQMVSRANESKKAQELVSKYQQQLQDVTAAFWSEPCRDLRERTRLLLVK